MEKFRTENEIDLSRIFRREETFIAPQPVEEEPGSDNDAFEAEEEIVSAKTTKSFEQDEEQGGTGNQRTNLYQVVERDQTSASNRIKFETSLAQDSAALAAALEAREEAQDSDFKLISALGTPLVMPVKIEGYQLPNEPIITITGSKKIVKTALTGVNREDQVQRRGTVKELVSVDDYKIKITGRIIDEDDPERYPERIVTKIRNLFELRRSLTINCKMTDLLGITHIALDKLSFPGDPGMQNSQRYEISGFSDEDFRTDLISQETT